MENDSGKSLPGSSYEADWQIPQGVTPSNWEYVQAAHISNGYDEFLLDDPLTEVDRQIISRYLPDLSGVDVAASAPTKPLVADFGCGNGAHVDPAVESRVPRVWHRFINSDAESFSKKIRVQAGEN